LTAGLKRLDRFGLVISRQSLGIRGKADVFALTYPAEQAALCWSREEKGRSMALDTNTFLMVLAAAIIVMGVAVWAMFKKAS